MQDIKTLIDKASKVCGSDKALAEKMGIKVQVVSMLRHGRPITPETAIELADIAGENIQEAAMAAIVTRSEGTRRGQVLKEIVGKLSKAATAGAVAMLLISSPNGARSTERTGQQHLTAYTSWKVRLARFRQLLQAAHWVLRSNMGEPPPYPTLFISNSKETRQALEALRTPGTCRVFP